MIYVIARNHYQARAWMLSSGLRLHKDAVYVSSLDRLRGLRNIKYVLVGAWYEHPDIHNMLTMMERIQGVKITYSNKIE